MHKFEKLKCEETKKQNYIEHGSSTIDAIFDLPKTKTLNLEEFFKCQATKLFPSLGRVSQYVSHEFQVGRVWGGRVGPYAKVGANGQ